MSLIYHVYFLKTYKYFNYIKLDIICNETRIAFVKDMKWHNGQIYKYVFYNIPCMKHRKFCFSPENSFTTYKYVIMKTLSVSHLNFKQTNIFNEKASRLSKNGPWGSNSATKRLFLYSHFVKNYIYYFWKQHHSYCDYVKNWWVYIILTSCSK